MKLKGKVLKDFYDKNEQKIYNKDDIYKSETERYEYLYKLGFIEKGVEEVKNGNSLQKS